MGQQQEELPADSCVFRWTVFLGIQLAVGPQPLRLRNHNFGLAQRIMVKRLETSPHDPLGITDSACKNQLVVVSVQYGPFNPYILIRSTTIGKSRVARDPITMHTSWRSNSDITSVTRNETLIRPPAAALRGGASLASACGPRTMNAQQPGDAPAPLRERCTIAARLRRWRLDVGWPLLRRHAARGARWPDDAADDGRAMEALVDVARAALRCVAFCAMVRALPPRFQGGGAAVAGRCSDAAPACLRRCRDGWSDFF
ncbi:cleavage stimulation factor subunit 2-like [Dorcoceras hygrometricum]|uniref:Cleavage stimulation factor subunit 2-like n=1 Tax=Dorcoceras hygrometricum TaxID=472368 RepID=A0A2Z7BGA9_9LAMI|nr:cleavage stimulation factor subunit 2-like [Dorcoceras hygrometricum]